MPEFEDESSPPLPISLVTENFDDPRRLAEMVIAVNITIHQGAPVIAFRDGQFFMWPEKEKIPEQLVRAVVWRTLESFWGFRASLTGEVKTPTRASDVNDVLDAVKGLLLLDEYFRFSTAPDIAAIHGLVNWTEAEAYWTHLAEQLKRYGRMFIYEQAEDSV
ncbi:hypothetical protein OAL44_00625 [Planctomycetaceae bacterium]|nr:hypothetical protein [Planctomycetaceae bacterium]